MDERVRLLPPFDAQTREVQQIYPFEKLLPPRVFQTLAAEAKELVAALPGSIAETWTTSAGYPVCVANRIMRLPIAGAHIDSKPSSPCFKAAQRLTLLRHMVLLMQMSSRDIQRKQPLPLAPKPLSNYLLREFTVLMARGNTGRVKVR